MKDWLGLLVIFLRGKIAYWVINLEFSVFDPFALLFKAVGFFLRLTFDSMNDKTAYFDLEFLDFNQFR